ncbi:hypothetical protein C8A01DRAFT_42981 [Parachaetomium inaequale]|uniref:Uncharacterized protein n=1 Tax=Parachaetomium inaequale TaxID=2588326 RepID=A0AAN6SW65_9PEZI|nr:hypothetical protein C8A01DRAFT_42981 [Parachaetomium inaequale]
MVTTRRRARPPSPADDHGSSDDASIPARTPPVRRPQLAPGTPATLRPSREPATGNTSLAKRKRGSTTAPDGPQQKRRRPAPDADTIEVQGEDDDDDVDAAIDATSARSTPRVEILLPSVRRPQDLDRATFTRVPSEPSTTTTTGRRLRARRLKRRINSVEVFGTLDSSRPEGRKHGNAVRGGGRETPEPEHRGHSDESAEEDVPTAKSPEILGSPELQSSAAKPRPAKPRPAKPSVDVYKFPDDNEPELPNPALDHRPKTINNLEALTRRKTTRRAPRRPRSPQRNARLSLIREEEQSPSANPTPPHPGTRQIVAPGPGPGDDLLVIDEEDRELVEYRNGSEAAHSTDGEQELENEKETDDSGSDEGAEDREMAGIQVRPYVADEHTISVHSLHLNNISQIMGRSGWTGAGGRWMVKLRDTMPDFGDEPPARTKLGKRIFRFLGLLKDQLEEVPNAMDLDGQSRFLAKHQEPLNRAMSSVDKAVGRIEAIGSQAVGDRASRTVKDLQTCVIPMLVLVLRTSFAIGVKEPDAVVSDSVPPEGVFTWTTVQYLMGVLAWLARLQRLLPSDEDADSDVPRQHDPESAAQNLRKVGVMVKKWMQQLRLAVDKFNEQADIIRDRHEKKERDRKIKQQKQKKEEEELALAWRLEQAYLLSLAQLTTKPRPMAQKFHKATAHWTVSSPSSSQHTAATQRSDPGSGTLTTLGQARSRSSGASRLLFPPAALQQQPALPPPAPEYPPWAEDETEWLLDELQRRDRRPNHLDVCAETLERSLEDVRREKARLERRGLYRSPGRGRGR